jgi:hypothetical protein
MASDTVFDTCGDLAQSNTAVAARNTLDWRVNKAAAGEWRCAVQAADADAAHIE